MLLRRHLILLIAIFRFFDASYLFRAMMLLMLCRYFCRYAAAR